MDWSDKHPFWHGSSHMGFVLNAAGYDEAWVSAEGCWLTDRRGRRYLDGRSGIGNMILGYSRSDIADAMDRQARSLPFVCTMRYDRAADVIVEHATNLVSQAPAGLTRVRYAHTGSSAVEMAVMIARRYHAITSGPERDQVVSLEGSFHGASHLTMAAGGIAPLQQAHAPMAPGFSTAPRPAADDADGAVALADMGAHIDQLGPQNVAAILLEPIEGLSGHALPSAYLQGVRRLCDEHGILLIHDEVFSGLGRMGYWFASEAAGVSPDLLCLSKAVAAGYAPLSAVLATDQIYDAFNAPMRYFAAASSTDAHPVSCAAALATFEALQGGELEAGRDVGAAVAARLRQALEHSPLLRQIRQTGPYVAVDIVEPDDFQQMMQMKRYLQAEVEKRGVLIDYTPQTVMLTPPYVMRQEETELLADALADALDEFDPERINEAALRPPSLRGHR